MNEVDSSCIPQIVKGDGDGGIMESGDQRIPLYPEGILPADPEFDIPSFDGDKTNLTLRRNVKLYNVWSIWSDMRRNEKLIKCLEAKKRDNEDMKYLKAIVTIALDRLGKALGDTNIVEEVCLDTEERKPEDKTPQDLEKTPAELNKESVK